MNKVLVYTLAILGAVTLYKTVRDYILDDVEIHIDKKSEKVETE